MLEIIALIFLCKKNGILAAQKGLKPNTWKIYTVLAWLAAESAGVIIGLMLFGKEDLYGIMAFALACAFGGYLIIKNVLERKEDFFEDEIDTISIDDLGPPRKFKDS